MIALIGLGLVTIAYGVGVRRLHARAGVGRGIASWRVWAFAGAILTLAVAFAPPVDEITDGLFAAHMAQHVLLAVIAPPLLVAGMPGVMLLWTLDANRRRNVALWFARSDARRVWRTATLPLVAWLLHAIAIWAWHLPRLYVAALDHETLHWLEHLSFAGTGVLLWWSILYPRGARRTGYGLGMLTLFGTAMHSGALGALLTLTHRVVYPIQESGAASYGLTPLEDQQIAGLIMWVVGGLLYVGAMSAVFLAWVSGVPKRRRIVAAAVAASAVASAGCGRAQASVVAGGDVDRGRASLSAMGCGSCHTIPGVGGAKGLVGPPLTGIGSRSIIAGELPNTPDNLMRWIQDPTGVEPRTAMPNMHIGDQEARDIAAYLYTLH